jgi:hypothetical protein
MTFYGLTTMEAFQTHGILSVGLFPVYVTLGQTAEKKPRPKVGHIIFYAVQVVSKENKQLIHPRTSCY